MSNDNARKTKKVVRRSIPVFIQNKRGPNAAGNQGDNQIPSGLATSGPSGDGKSTKTKHGTSSSERTLSSFRERIDEQPKSRPPLSLQGPFNPNIVGHRRHEEIKRKRIPTPKATNDQSSTNLGEKDHHNSQGQTQPPTTELFSNIKLVDQDEHKPKRNPTKEKKRCSVEFQHKPDTNFAENIDKSVLFTAGSITSKSTGKSHSKAAASRYRDPWKTERLLKEKLQIIESEKDSLAGEFKKAISDLEKQLHLEKEEAAKLKSEKGSLEEALKENDTINKVAVEEKTKTLTLQNETLQERLENCQQKLEELNVDPIKLTTLPSSSEEDLERKKAVDQAAALREELSNMKKRNLEIIASLKSVDMKENAPMGQLQPDLSNEPTSA